MQFVCISNRVFLAVNSAHLERLISGVFYTCDFTYEWQPAIDHPFMELIHPFLKFVRGSRITVFAYEDGLVKLPEGDVIIEMEVPELENLIHNYNEDKWSLEGSTSGCTDSEDEQESDNSRG